MSYLDFLLTNKRLLTFGILLTFSSSFGQTFLISLFVPHFLEEFSLTQGQFGSFYSGITLLSALCIPYLGGILDRTQLRHYTLSLVVILALSSLTIFAAQNVILLFVGLLGVRLTGQGLLSHTALTSMARYFDNVRGKALGIVNTGFPFGEATFPVILAATIHLIGWRWSWALIGGFAVVILAPVVILLLSQLPSESDSAAVQENTNPTRDSWDRKRVLKDPSFYGLLPGLLVLPFIITGLFLYQSLLADSKGWTTATMALAFTTFALGRVLVSLLAGPLVDRFSACRLVPVFLFPLVAGLLGLAWFSGPWVPLVCFLLAGTSQGLAGVLKSAIWAEIYGVRYLGSIRSMTSSLAIFSCALSPALMGHLLDAGTSFDSMIYGGVILIGVITALVSWTSLNLYSSRVCPQHGL